MNVQALKCWRKLQAAGLEIEVIELAAVAGRAAPAGAAAVAAAVGCVPGQVVTAQLHVVKAKPLLVLCPGDRHVDLAKLGAGSARARLDQVIGATGFAEGSVPPLCHARPLPTVADESLRRFTTVWCTAGTPDAVFEVTLDALLAAIAGVAMRDICSA